MFGGGPNLMQFLSSVKSGQINPERFAMLLLQQNMGNSPMGQNLMQLAQQGRTGDIETVVRNFMKQNGVDYDKAFSEFRQNLGI